MTQLTEKANQLIRLATWHPDTPLSVVKQFDTLAYSVIGDIQSQELWIKDVVLELDKMAEWEVIGSPEEPNAAAAARKLLLQLGISGPLNLNGVSR